MKQSISTILIFISLLGKAQPYANIVPDSSLEAHLECDDSLYNTNPTFLTIANRFVYWRSGTKNTAEAFYLSTCTPSNTPYVGYPYTAMGGFVYPRTGNGFGGIQGTFDPINNPNYRDYLQVQLLMPLEAGKRYYGGFYVQFNDQNYNKYSTNNLGMLLTDSVANPDSVPWNTVIQGIPQIINDTTYELKDTLNWVLVADTFIAQGGEKWLTIGNFRDDAHSVLILTGYNSNIGSYYFVDDVFLYCIDTACATVPPIGIKESPKQNSNFSLYPNPGSDELTVEFDAINENEKAAITINSLDGKLLIQKDLVVHTNVTRTSLKELSNGVYICKLVKNGIAIANERLVIMK